MTAGGADAGFTVERYSPAAKDRWDDVVRRSRTAHFLFHRDYMDYHADRFEDGSLLVLEGRRLAAVLPANVAGDALVSHGGLTFGGVVSDARLTTDRMLAVFDAILAELCDRGLRRWVYKAVPHIYSAVPSEEDLYALFRSGAQLVRRDVAAAILMAERLPYSKGRRSSVKRAGREGLTVGRDDDFAGFLAVEKALLEARHGVAPVHTAAEMELLAGRFPDAIKLFTARRDGELLGGVIVYETPQVAHAQYIGATEEGRAAGAVDAVVDHLLSDVYAAKRWFDFGISTEDAGRVLNVGLMRNKESYGARAVAYDTYEVAV